MGQSLKKFWNHNNIDSSMPFLLRIIVLSVSSLFLSVTVATAQIDLKDTNCPDVILEAESDAEMTITLRTIYEKTGMKMQYVLDYLNVSGYKCSNIANKDQTENNYQHRCTIEGSTIVAQLNTIPPIFEKIYPYRQIMLGEKGNQSYIHVKLIAILP